jgi:site-specific recombinase XerD
MQDLKQEIAEKIAANRPKLSANSLKTYVSILSNIYKAMKGDGGVEFFSDNVNDIIKFMDTKNNQTKKTSLSALFVLTKKEEYREVMTTVMNAVNATYKEQKKTPKQEDNWMSSEEVKAVYDKQLENALLMLSKKAKFNDGKFIEFLLVAFLSGVIMPPRRSQDYGEIKIRNYDPKTDNYYKAGKFFYNKYKTAKTYGLQTLDVPKELNTLLKKWIKLNSNDYMLYSTNGNKLSSPQINRILNEAFGKAISTNMLRHIYLTEQYKNVPAIADMQELAREMGHSISQGMEYVKKK